MITGSMHSTSRATHIAGQTAKDRKLLYSCCSIICCYKVWVLAAISEHINEDTTIPFFLL